MYRKIFKENKSRRGKVVTASLIPGAAGTFQIEVKSDNI